MHTTDDHPTLPLSEYSRRLRSADTRCRFVYLNLKRTRSVQACEEAKAKMGLAEVEEKPLTVPRPFNLTKPNPRKVPEPMKIEQVKTIFTTCCRRHRYALLTLLEPSYTILDTFLETE